MYIKSEFYLIRIDAKAIIKIADFGLCEEIYTKNYFRQEAHATVKLPIKWMAIESLQEGIFSEKTDVVSLIYMLSQRIFSARREYTSRSLDVFIKLDLLHWFVVVIWSDLLGSIQWW